jgi:hypothetical protein
MKRRAIAALVACLGLGLAAHAGADARAHLSWVRPPDGECPSSEAVAHDVDGLLGRAAFGSPPGDVAIAGVLREQGDEVIAELVARVAGEVVGVRQLSAPRGDCAALRRPIALVLAMLLDDASALVKPAVPAPRARVRGYGALSAGGRLGLLPRASAAFDTSVGLTLASGLTLSVRAGYALPVEARTDRGAGGRFQALLAELGVCPALSRTDRAFVVRGCAGLSLDTLVATPVGLDGASTELRLAAAVPLSVAIAMRLSGGTWLELAAGPSIFVIRPTATMALRDGREQLVHRPESVAGFFRAAFIMGPR